MALAFFTASAFKTFAEHTNKYNIFILQEKFIVYICCFACSTFTIRSLHSLDSIIFIFKEFVIFPQTWKLEFKNIFKKFTTKVNSK